MAVEKAVLPREFLQVGNECAALLVRQAFDVAGPAPDIERDPAALRVPAQDRVINVGPPQALDLAQWRQVRVVDMMQRGAAEACPPAGELRPHRLRQRLTGGVHVGEDRVALLGRHLQRIEKGAGVRHRLVFAVGMKPHAGAAQAELFSVLLRVPDDEDLGMRFEVELGRHHDVQCPEAPGKGDLLLGRHVEPAENEDRMPVPCRFDLAECRIVDGEIRRRANDFRAEAAFERAEFEPHRLLSSEPRCAAYRRGRARGNRPAVDPTPRMAKDCAHCD